MKRCVTRADCMKNCTAINCAKTDQTRDTTPCGLDHADITNPNQTKSNFNDIADDAKLRPERNHSQKGQQPKINRAAMTRADRRSA